MFPRVAFIAFLAFVMPDVLRADSAESDLSIKVSPQYCAEPCLIRVQVRLEPHPDDRALVIEADNGEYFRSSLVQLPGDRGPSIHTLTLKSLPAGRFSIRVMLSRTDGVEALARDSINVLGM